MITKPMACVTINAALHTRSEHPFAVRNHPMKKHLTLLTLYTFTAIFALGAAEKRLPTRHTAKAVAA